jgi:hypothetical protein
MELRDPATRAASLIGRLPDSRALTGAIRPRVRRTYRLEEGVQALEDLAQRRVMGKAVLAID